MKNYIGKGGKEGWKEGKKPMIKEITSYEDFFEILNSKTVNLLKNTIRTVLGYSY